MEESQTGDTAYKSMAFMFKVGDKNAYQFGFRIGHLVKANTSGNTTLKIDEKPISIKNIKIIRISKERKISKYYLETEDKYKERVLNFFKDAEYSNSLPIPGITKENLAFVSLPFEHKIYDCKEKEGEYIPPYTFYYNGLGRVCFRGNILNDSDIPKGKTRTKPYLSLAYDVEPFNIFLTARAKYPSYAKFAKEEDVGQVYGEHFKQEQAIIGAHNTKNDDFLGIYNYSHLSNLEIKEKTTIWNTITLPVYQVGNPYLPELNDKTVEEAYIITNLINNPHGYHFETPIEAVYSDNDSVYVDIPIYKYSNEEGDKYGEIRLIMKNAEYNTDLPTVVCDIKYPNM